MSVFIFASLHSLPQHAAQVNAALKVLADSSRREPGCLRYELYHADSAPALLHVFEEYRDEAAVAAHRGATHYQDFRQFVGDKLLNPVGLKILRQLG